MTKPKLRVFLDSNVIFSGLYSSQKAPGKILEYFIQGRICVVISRQVLEEIVRVMKEKLPGALPFLNQLLMSSPPEIIADPLPAEVECWSRLLKMGDAAILAAVISARPDYFVTGDNHFLNNRGMAEETGLHIITPAELWELLN